MHVALLDGRLQKVDVVVPRHRVVVLVDGCFWHACPRHGTMPKANRTFWAAKFAANRTRDRDTDRRLRALGWRVFRVWEHESPSTAAGRIARWVQAKTEVDGRRF